MSSGSNTAEPDPDWVTVAVLGRTRGNRGELTAISLTKPERFESLSEVFLFPEGLRQEVESAWFHDPAAAGLRE